MYEELEYTSEKDPKETKAVMVPEVDVTDDLDVINTVQKRRLLLAQGISEDGINFANPKERYLYLAALKDTADSAQRRIDADQKQESGERDRNLVREVVKSMADMHPVNLPETGTIPSPPKSLSGREVSADVLSKETRDETHDEFMARMAVEMENKYADDVES